MNKIKLKNIIRNKTYALRLKGELVEKPCEICGEEKVEAHHSDYNEWKDVEWFCKKHHVLWHTLNKAIEPVGLPKDIGYSPLKPRKPKESGTSMTIVNKRTFRNQMSRYTKGFDVVVVKNNMKLAGVYINLSDGVDPEKVSSIVKDLLNNN